MLQELRKAIAEYANGERTSAALREWLAVNVQAVLDSGEQETIAVVDELEALFARLSEGLVTERDIFDAATACIRTAQTERRPLPAQEVLTTSGAATYRDDSSRADRLVRVA